MTNIDRFQQLIRERAELEARLALMPYDGSPEVKENKSGKYLYIRKRVGSRLTSTYVGNYSDELYQLLLRNAKESREIRKRIRCIVGELAKLGYTKTDLHPDVILNLDFARANLKKSIYDQAVLEGVSTTFPQTEDIVDNGYVNGMTATDVQKILNLKHAWEFILDEDVIQAQSDYYLLRHIAKLINEGFYSNGGNIRSVPVTIGGSDYIPPIPVEADVKEDLNEILESDIPDVDKAISLCMYIMKTQVFIDGNKRAAFILANHFLISKGAGLMIVPEKNVSEFKKHLVKYYEGEDIDKIRDFLKKNAIKPLR